MPRGRACLAALSFALFAFGPAPAAAQESPQPDAREVARSLADEAANAYAEAEYARALELLQRAYALVPAPTIALLEARSLARLGRLVEGCAAYERVIETPVSAESPPAFARAVGEARPELQALARRVPRLKLIGSRKEPRSASILLDGKLLDPSLLGVWIPVDPGSHVIVLEQDGRGARSREVAVAEGTRREVVLDDEAGAQESRFPTAGVIALAVGGVGIGTGIVSGLMAVGAHDDASESCPNDVCPRGSPGADALDDFETYRTVSTVSYIVGAAGLGLGAYLLLTGSHSASAGLAVSPAFSGFELRGSL